MERKVATGETCHDLAASAAKHAGFTHHYPKTVPVPGFYREYRIPRKTIDLARDHVEHPTMGHHKNSIAWFTDSDFRCCSQNPVCKFVHGLTADKLRSRVAAQNLFQLRRVLLCQLIFRYALDGPEVPLLETFVNVRPGKSQSAGDDLCRLSGAREWT
jgi:hypothetical protein